MDLGERLAFAEDVAIHVRQLKIERLGLADQKRAALRGQVLLHPAVHDVRGIRV